MARGVGNDMGMAQWVDEQTRQWQNDGGKEERGRILQIFSLPVV
jgi:hypothetical protein